VAGRPNTGPRPPSPCREAEPLLEDVYLHRFGDEVGL